MPGAQTETPASNTSTNGRAHDAAAEREAILAELAASRKPTAAKPAAAAPAEQEEQEPGEQAEVDHDQEQDAGDERESEVEAKADEESEQEQEQEQDADKADAKAKDEKADKDEDEPAVRRGLEKVRKAEKRMREELARERQELTAEFERRYRQFEAEWAPKVEKAQKFEQLAERVNIDAISVLESLGLKPELYEAVAKDLYSIAKGQNREALAARMQAREQRSELEKLRDEVRALREEHARREAEERATREAAAYLDSITTAAKADDSEAPLARHFLAKNPEKTRDRLAQIAMAILEETGEKPDAEDVLAEYERIRRAELEELGVDVDALLKAPKKQTKQADEKRPAKTLSNDLSTTTPVPRSAPKSEDELREEILRDLQKMRAAGNAG